MERIFTAVFLFIFGAAFGSFACCQVWRIRKKDKSKWSHCMNCKYRLQWYDNIPIISWLMLGGKCRKCRKKIGYSEILAEVGLAVVFLLSFLLWPGQDKLMNLDVIEAIKFALFLINLTIFTILFIYDAKWKELPLALMLVSAGIAAIFLGLSVYQSYTATGNYDWLSLGLAILFLPGIYYLMYKVSGEKWVGGGDWILCIPLALMLGDAWLAAFCMFVSNIFGCITMAPIALIKKKKGMQIPFGPFLIIGFLVVFLIQDFIFKFTSI